MRRFLMAGVATAALLLGSFGASAAPDPMQLVEPISQYKLYVIDQVGVLLKDTTAFADAIKAGDLAKAKSLSGSSRVA